MLVKLRTISVTAVLELSICLTDAMVITEVTGIGCPSLVLNRSGGASYDNAVLTGVV